MGFEVVTVAQRPDLNAEAETAFRGRWPEFIFHDALPREYMPRVDEYFVEYAIFLLDDGHVAAGGWGVPLVWDQTPDGLPEGYRTALMAAVEDHEAGRAPNAFSFMAATVAESYDKQGLATKVLSALIQRATAAGLTRVVAPIRPTWKQKYPLVSMAEYAGWTREDGFSTDPWIRTHQRIGASVIKPAPNSVVVSACVADWEACPGQRFLSRSRSAEPRRDRPRARSRNLPRGQPLGATPMTPR